MLAAERLEQGSTRADEEPLAASATEGQVDARARALAKRLVTQRQSIGLTAKQISECTKLHPRFVDAIEEGEFNRLPGGFLSKSFIRAYAQCVRLNDLEVVTQYLELDEPKRSSCDVHDRSHATAGNKIRPNRSRFAMVVVICGLLIGSFLLGRYWQQGHGAVETTQATIPNHVTPLPLGSFQRVGSASQMRTPTDVPTASPVSTYVVPDRQVLSGESECSSGAFCIEINARQDAWISINADGKVIMRDTLVAPARKHIAARDRVTIRAGNIGALDFSFNGTALPPQGNYDEARTLSFTTAGLERNLNPKSTVVTTSSTPFPD